MEKKKKEKERERERERERDAAGFAAAVGHACATAFGRKATCTQIEEEQRDETAIGTAVRTAKCREKISGDWELGQKKILKEFELIDEKDFENNF